MSEPLLSVVVCNYNHAAYLGRSLGALLAQSRRPDELLVIDDGSTDDSLTVLEGLAARDPLVQVIRRPRNQGLHAGLALALRTLHGRWFYSGGADDCVLPGFFEAAMDMAEKHPQAGLVCGKLVAVDPGGRRLHTSEVSSWTQPLYATPERFRREYLEAEDPTHALGGSVVYRADALREVGGFRPELGGFCDNFASRAIGLKHGAGYVPREFSLFTILPGSVSQSLLHEVGRYFEVVERAAALMRSAEFRDRFPEEHVRRWLSGYRARVLVRSARAVPRLPAPARATAWRELMPLLVRHLPDIVAEAVRGAGRRARRASTRRR